MKESAAAFIWRWYANVVGALVLAALVSLSIMWSFAQSGEVVEVVEGPAVTDVYRVPHRGMLKYLVTTRRHESCPGTVIRRFVRQDAVRVVVSLNAPVTPAEISIKPIQTTVEIQLPENISPGIWEYSTIVDSQCPTRRASEVIARFMIEVTPQTAG